jgi:hypothetical protein
LSRAVVPLGRPAPVTVDAIAHLDVVVVAVGIVGEGGGGNAESVFCVSQLKHEASEIWKLSRKLPADFQVPHCQLLPDS